MPVFNKTIINTELSWVQLSGLSFQKSLAPWSTSKMLVDFGSRCSSLCCMCVQSRNTDISHTSNIRLILCMFVEVCGSGELDPNTKQVSLSLYWLPPQGLCFDTTFFYLSAPMPVLLHNSILEISPTFTWFSCGCRICSSKLLQLRLKDTLAIVSGGFAQLRLLWSTDRAACHRWGTKVRLVVRITITSVASDS